jgi:hypothetical protein
MSISSGNVDFDTYPNIHRDSGRKFTLVRKVIEKTPLGHASFLSDVVYCDSIDGAVREKL